MDNRSTNRSIELLSKRISQLQKLTANLPVRLDPPSVWEMAIVKIRSYWRGDNGTLAGGFYNVAALGGGPQNAGTHAVAGNNLTMPEGMDVPPSDDVAILLNLFENARN